jgi:hypothetical protein
MIIRVICVLNFRLVRVGERGGEEEKTQKGNFVVHPEKFVLSGISINLTIFAP